MFLGSYTPCSFTWNVSYVTFRSQLKHHLCRVGFTDRLPLHNLMNLNSPFLSPQSTTPSLFYVCVRSVAKQCPTLCNPMDCSPPDSVHGIFQARILKCLPFPPLGDLPNPGIEPASPVSPALAGGFFTTEPPGKLHNLCSEMHSKERK